MRFSHFILPASVALILSAGASLATAAGLTWPTNRFLPAFATAAANIDCIDISSASGAEQDLFASLAGIVNRTQPRIACVGNTEEGKFTWLNVHNLPYTLINGYSAIQKYQTNVTGLVVTDTNQPDTLNLATTIAGLNNELLCDPSLLPTLTNAPYNLAIKDDLRGRFSTKYTVYQYLYVNYWPQCTHRIIAGMETNGHGNLRDYLIAVKAASVWLDPGNSADAAALAPFMSGMTPVGGAYLGWWPSESSGLTWIAQYGIPVIASDWYQNGSLFGGVSPPLTIPTIPPAPPLQNKIYVSVTLSDGDNVQYMQHHLKANWGNAARGSVPIGWTLQPLSVDLDPGMLNYYWSTATTNDCLMSGPSGAGYTRINNWSPANTVAYAKASNPYLQRSGIRTITVWMTVSSGTGASFATNCPTLVGLNDQSGGYYTANDTGLPVIGFPSDDSYTSSESLLFNGITNTAASWHGTAPMFIAVQGSGWDISPADCQTLANSLDKNKYVFVRPDHLFLLYRQAAGLGTAAALPYFVSQPAGLSAPAGTNVTFSAQATGTAPLSFQWQLNGTNIAGATNSFCSRSNVQPSDAGNYTLVVTNVAGRAVSSNAVLTVINRSMAPPFAFSSAPLNLTPGAAVLMGFAVPNGTNTIAWFDWGTNADYGRQTVATNVGNGYQVMLVRAALGGLLNGVIYHARLSASNNVGPTHGNDVLFTAGGRAKAWGDNTYGQTNVPGGLTNVVAIASGGYHGLAVRNNGTVVGWGYNAYGQATPPAGLTNAAAAAAGFYHSLALKTDGTVSAWGGNNFAQLAVPSDLANVTAIAAGAYHSLALEMDGTVRAWGDNNDGQTNVPDGLANVVAITAGLYDSAALKADGTVTVWGDNAYGETSFPAGLSNVVAITAGAFHFLALKADGTVVAWGRNNTGQTNVPPALGAVAAVAGGDYFSLALQTNGAVAAWGENSYGQTNVPHWLTNFVQLAGGMYHGLAIGNGIPQASAQAVNGYVNHDLVITLSGLADEGDALSYRLTAPPVVGALYQYSSGSRGNALTPGNPVVTDSGGRLIFAAQTNAVGTPYDGFDFAADDGFNESAPAMVAVNLGLPIPPGSLAGSVVDNGTTGFQLMFTGSSNATYNVWASTNLFQWSWLGAASENFPGQYLFDDLSATNRGQCFYRVTAP